MSYPLITADELRGLIERQAPLRILDCRARLGDPEAGRHLWRQGHLPGSQHLDLDRDLAAPPGEGGRHPLPSRDAFTASLQRLGLGPEATLVVYDDRGGQLAAARAWWMLARWAGHPAVRVLDGGLAAWQAAGGVLEIEVESEALPLEPSDWTPSFDDGAWVTADALLTESPRLVDARGEARFRGEEEPIDPVAGHIPGARCHPSAANLTAEGRFRPAEALARALPEAEVAYCGSGVTACHNILAYAVAGRPLPRLYAGSWSEWIRDPDHPIER
ncbi:sulfurtransferase [Halomonas sp. 328]|uniref:sulfurtransferase n=1 Tax=Halomonas sp. 328 TaxID=2776704 RepID=UPI0018A6DACE|nr:sulfurtransferase [Halomonas sp. 328]MBF8223006.1 sulfurtransferase [Halomonas sp. 328]